MGPGLDGVLEIAAGEMGVELGWASVCVEGLERKARVLLEERRGMDSAVARLRWSCWRGKRRTWWALWGNRVVLSGKEGDIQGVDHCLRKRKK